jgi:hypothetical protein
MISPSQRRHLARLASQQHQPLALLVNHLLYVLNDNPYSMSHLHLREHGALEGHNSLSMASPATQSKGGNWSKK